MAALTDFFHKPAPKPKRTRKKAEEIKIDREDFTGGVNEIPETPFLPGELTKEIPQQELGPKHWTLIAKTVVQPKPLMVPDNPEVTRLSVTGKTTYLFQCEETGDFRKEEIEGIEPTDLDLIIQKVESSGPEYIVRDTGTYILMKKPAAALPVK